MVGIVTVEYLPGPATDATDIPKTSSAVLPSISRPVLETTVLGDPSDLDPINQSPWYDPLCPEMVSIFDGIVTVGYERYIGQPITTIAFKYYQTTTGWWIILQYNGFLHPDEIPLGTNLAIPDLGAIQTQLRAKITVGKSVLVF